MITTDAFFEVDRKTVNTSQGPVELPIMYYDVTFFLALFLVEESAATRLLSPLGLKPAVAGLGKTIGGLAIYEYRNTSVGVYNEVGLALAAVPAGRILPFLSPMDLFLPLGLRTMGFAVLNLPVTTAKANAAGREIWGYPKFVADIPIKYTADSFSASVKDPDDKSDIFTLSGALKPGIKMPSFHLTTYSQLANNTIRTNITVRGHFQVQNNTDFILKVGKSNHNMAENIRTLGLNQAEPVLLGISHDWQSRLPSGIKI